MDDMKCPIRHGRLRFLAYTNPSVVLQCDEGHITRFKFDSHEKVSEA